MSTLNNTLGYYKHVVVLLDFYVMCTVYIGNDNVINIIAIRRTRSGGLKALLQSTMVFFRNETNLAGEFVREIRVGGISRRCTRSRRAVIKYLYGAVISTNIRAAPIRRKQLLIYRRKRSFSLTRFSNSFSSFSRIFRVQRENNS